ncbi:universal stress protein [Glycomyces terrestris]|uniref:Universal stress protein n=1 Tax=Glycomyces terrestris TaxID=2493553 RepID=A0A426V3K3_9ACTN|nr:universal stress protein [Glycomyces terrestris]RRS01425.1 universal stress protein [Glycomyces terrestris]
MSGRSHSDSAIIVGVDGSAPSLGALDWAMQYAALTGAPVLAVRAWQVPFASGADATAVSATEFVKAMGRELEQAVHEAALEHPRVRVATLLTEGRPGRVLLERSGHSALLVVGNCRRGRLVGAVIGSVTRYCITHGHGPVVVVPGRQQSKPAA